MAKTFTKFRSDLDEDILSLLEDDETELKVQAKTPGVAASLPTDEDELEDDDYAEWETVDAIPQTYVRGKNGTVTHHDEGVGQKGAEIPEAEMAEDLDEEVERLDELTPAEADAMRLLIKNRQRIADAKKAKANPQPAKKTGGYVSQEAGITAREKAGTFQGMRVKKDEYTPDHGETLDELGDTAAGRKRLDRVATRADNKLQHIRNNPVRPTRVGGPIVGIRRRGIHSDRDKNAGARFRQDDEYEKAQKTLDRAAERLHGDAYRNKKRPTTSDEYTPGHGEVIDEKDQSPAEKAYRTARKEKRAKGGPQFGTGRGAGQGSPGDDYERDRDERTASATKRPKTTQGHYGAPRKKPLGPSDPGGAARTLAISRHLGNRERDPGKATLDIRKRRARASRRTMVRKHGQENSEYTPDYDGETLGEINLTPPNVRATIEKGKKRVADAAQAKRKALHDKEDREDRESVDKTHPGSPQSRARTKAEYDAPRTPHDVGADINRAKEIERLKSARRARKLASDYTPDHGETFAETENVVPGGSYTKTERKAAAKRAKKNRKTRADKRKANEPDDSDYDKGNYPGYWGRKSDGSPADEDYRPSFKEFRDSFKEEPVYENVMDSLKKIVSRNQKSSLTFDDGTGTDVDPKQATNILQVYGALSKNNQPKMAAMIAKDGAGFSKALSFAQSHDGESHLASTEL
jgi:hypothetical protein